MQSLEECIKIIELQQAIYLLISYLIIYMQRKSLEKIDFFSHHEQNNPTNEYIQPSNINVFSSMEYCSTFQLQDSTRQCRICLEQIQSARHTFVSPCKCTGSLKFVHESCFMMWLDRLYNSKSNIEQKIMKSAGLPCQICKEKVYLNFKNKLFCLSQEELKRKISNNLLIFIVLIVFLVIIFATISFVIFFMQKSENSFGIDIISSVIVVCALAFLTTASILSLYYITTRFCMQSRSTLSSFQLQKEITQFKNKRKVIPMPMS